LSIDRKCREGRDEVIGLYAATGIFLLVSFAANRHKTGAALKHAWQSLIHILPAFFMMMMSVSVILGLLPENAILHYLNNVSGFFGVFSALLAGSLTVMPGFIAFPLCGILLKQGVSYMVLSAFSTSLMMVGVLTYPIEKKYFSAKVAIMRNAAGLVIAFIVAMITGLFFGELF